MISIFVFLAKTKCNLIIILSLMLSVRLSSCLSVRLSVCLSVRLSSCLSVCLSRRLFIVPGHNIGLNITSRLIPNLACLPDMSQVMSEKSAVFAIADKSTNVAKSTI